MPTSNVQVYVFFLTAFAILLPIQVSLGLQRRTYDFLVAMIFGLALEVIAYVALILLHDGQSRYVTMYLVTITVAPTMINTAINLSVPRVIETYGAHLSTILPKAYKTTFVLADATALVLQATGGIVAGVSSMGRFDTGLRIIQIGLVLQLISMFAFAVSTLLFAFKAQRRSSEWAKQFEELRRSRIFKAFLAGLAIAFIAVFIRTSYRAAQPSAGLSGDSEIRFLVLDGGMILLGCMALTILHPGVVFRNTAGSVEEPTVRWEDVKA